MKYTDIEKLAEIFEKLAQEIPSIEEGGHTLTENMVRPIEVEVSNKFSAILMKNFRKSSEGRAKPGEPPPMPPRSYVAITRFDHPGFEFTIGLQRELSQHILNKTILEVDNWLKSESRYRNNQWINNSTWKVVIVGQQ